MPTPRYKIRPDTGDLQEYLFEYNGILALKNFVARVDGERLILHSAADMNFSILDALVSEVEIDGRVYDNAEAAQEALMRLTFNTNRPVLMTQQERELLQGALQRGTYVGTAADLKALLDGKVDKVPGKMLSTNDFTNELRTKLEGLRNVDISGLLPKGGYTGTAQNLKELIDNIMRILQSPDTELDELREIVAYIKQNKRTLDTLGISNIAGLQDTLNGKAPTDHNHDDRYSRLGHTHTEYAYRTHRHRWDDIDGKPALATEGKIQEEIRKIQVGGRNLLHNSRELIINNNYNLAVYYLTEELRDGEVVTLTIKGRLGAGKRAFAAYNNGDFLQLSLLLDKGNGIYQSTFNWSKVVGSRVAGNKTLWIWTYDGSVSVDSTIEWIKLERGNTATDWTPAPEDFRIGTIMNGTRQILPNEEIVYVTATVPNCDLQDVPDRYSVVFRKVFAGGSVTFTCLGKTIIYTGDNAFNGGDGSTAVVSIYGNKCYIDIRNV